MEMREFANVVTGKLQERLCENAVMKINTVLKNNGLVLTGLSINEDSVNISPTIYLNNYLEDYESGVMTLDNIVDDIYDIYKRNKMKRSVDMRFFMNFDKVEDRIIFKLINAKMNEQLLRDVPHIKYLDFAIVFQCLISEEEYGNATILIHNAHLKIWHTTVEELHQKALINTPRLQKCNIVNMRDVLIEMMMTNEMENADCSEIPDSFPMYVLSNKARVQGASCILYPNVLKQFAEKINSDVYVLPSSLHECILMPATGKEDAAELKNIVCQVNREQVEREEVLSDSVYLFRRDCNELEIVA